MQNLEKSTTKMKITETKVRSVGGDGGAVEEMMEIWPKPSEISPNPVSSHQIWQPNSSYARLTNANLHTVFSTFAARVSFVRSFLNPDDFLNKNPKPKKYY